MTASHNPIDYNGMKLVCKGSRLISSKTGLEEISFLTERGLFEAASSQGSLVYDQDKSEYTIETVTQAGGSPVHKQDRPRIYRKERMRADEVIERILTHYAPVHPKIDRYGRA